MAEYIDVYLNDEDLKKSVDEVNTKMKGMESQAEKVASAFKHVSDATASSINEFNRKIEIITSQVSQTTRTRGISAAERQLNQAKLEVAGPLDRFQRAQLDYERDISGKFAGNDKFIERRLDLYKQYIGVLGQLEIKQRQAANDQERLDRAIRASRNTTGQDQFQEALQLVQTRQKTRQGILSNLTYETATPVERLALRRDSTISKLQGAGASAAEIAAATAAFTKLENVALASSKNIGARIAEFITSPTYAARKSLGDFLQEFGKFGIIAGGVLIGVAAAATAAFSLIRSAGKEAEDLGNLADRLGVTGQQAAILAAQARIAGVSVDSLGGLVRKLSTNLVDGGTEARNTVRALSDIGVSVADAGGKFRDPIAILGDLSGKIGRMPSQAAQVDLLTKAFGRGSVELLPLIKHFSELQRQAEETGIGGIEPLRKRLQDVDDQLDKVGIRIDILKLKASEKILVFIETVFSGGDLERYKQDLLSLSPFRKPEPFQLPPPAPPPIPVSREALLTPAQRQGNLLLQQFEGRQTAQGVEDKIATLQQELQRQRALAVPDIDGKIQAGRIKDIQLTEQQIEKQKALLKIINGIDAAQKAANAEAIKSQKTLSDAIAARTAVLIGGNAAQIKLTEESAKALDHYRELQTKAKDDGLYNAAIEASFRKTLLAGIQTAIVNYGAENIKQIQEEGKAYRAYYSDRLQQELAFEAETVKLAQATTNSRLDFEETVAAQIRDQQIRAIERTDAKTLQQAVAFELQKGAIQSQYEQVSTQVRIDAIERAAEAEKRELEATIGQKLELQNLYQARVIAIDEATTEKERQLTIQSLNAIQKDREDAAIKAAQAITDANTKVFDTIKGEANGLLDAFFSKSQSVGQAIGAIFKSAFLTPIKDALSTQISTRITGAVTGQQVGLTPGTLATGPFGDLARRLGIGARPTFGAAAQVAKIEQAGHIGDVLLKPSAVGNAVPVLIANPEAISNKVEVTTPSAAAPLATLIAPSTPSPLAATLALFASLSGSLQPLSAGVQDTLVQSRLTGYSLQQLSSQVAQRGTVQSQLAQEELSKIAFSLDDIRRIPVLSPPSSPAAVAKVEQLQQATTLSIPSPLPVIVQNASDLQQKIDVNNTNNSQQVNQAVTVGASGVGGGGFAGGITRPPLDALLASLAASPQLVPSGFKTVGQSFATSETISYPELGLTQSFAPALRDQSFGFGGGGFGAGQALIGGGVTGSNIQELFSGSRNAFTGGTAGAVDALGIPVNQASERLTALTSQIGLPAAQAVAAKGGIKGLFSSLGGNFGKLFEKIGPKGFAAFGIPIGLGLMASGLAQPYGAAATAKAGLGGALAGFGIGAQFGLGFAGAEIGAGVGLVASGLRTGGGTGFAKDVAGGALVGLGIGGPLGAAIGAGAGALLGGLSLAGIIQTKNQKFHNKIKDIYHVDINDQKLLSQFSQIADQKYGGNVDVAVRSIEVRQIVQLWAQAHGQNSLGIVGTPQQSIFANQGGRLTEIPTYFNGQAVVPGDTRSTVGIPQLTPSGSYITVAAPQGANVSRSSSTILSLDADATTRVLQGQAAQVIQGQPRLISQQTSNGMGASSARRDIASAVMQPAFLTT